jgi:hypothetical protein
MLRNKIYYSIKPLIPRSLQIALRRRVVSRQRLLYKDIWPIDERTGKSPEGWTGWPENKQFALVLTHDVDTENGQDKCWKLAEMEKEIGFCSSFNFVPERYNVSYELREILARNGFEIGVHDLNHDGKLYKSENIFKERAERINRYLKDWKAVGFRSGSMHSNLEWIHDLDIKYDASTFDTDPFEPYPDGAGTIFPFWVSSNSSESRYIELPYTLPQDFTLFVLMKEKNVDIWKKKLDWIVEHGGMALLNIHPDYMNFSGDKLGLEEYPATYYQAFLEYVKYKYEGLYWHVLPGEIASYFNPSY